MEGIKKQKVVAEGIDFESLEQATKYFEIESKFIDETFTKNWFILFSAFAKYANKRIKAGKGIGFVGRILVSVVARMSGLTINRNKHWEVWGLQHGFRKGHEKYFIRSITVTVLKGKKEVGTKEINLTTL